MSRSSTILVFFVIVSLFCVLVCPVVSTAAGRRAGEHSCHAANNMPDGKTTKTRMLCCEQRGVTVSTFIPDSGPLLAVELPPPVYTPAAHAAVTADQPVSATQDTGERLACFSLLRI